jgi:hypothetical protein
MFILDFRIVFFYENKAVGNSSYGGAVYIEDVLAYRIERSDFR